MNKKALVSIVIFISALIWLYWFISTREAREYSRVMYQEHCASCHGDDLTGSAQGSNLMAQRLTYGDSTTFLMQSIQGEIKAHKALALPMDDGVETIKALSLYIGERRARFPLVKTSYEKTFTAKRIDSKYHRFRVEKFAELASRPYSIAPLADGRIIVSEKVRGLSVVNTNGEQGELISNTPSVYQQLVTVEGAYVGWGQFLEVALHPDYQSNGWVYLSYTDRCHLDCGSALPQTMVKVIRGRIENNTWIDQQDIWSVDKEYYTVVPDNVAGGRLGFDKNGYLYISVGGKSFYKYLHDMNTPYGKIHRVKDDGTVPLDNPFYLPKEQREASSTRHTVYSYGHRTVQGLEGHPVTGAIWSSEMGPRGGDEVNKIIMKGNYGWPLYSNGLDYDSSQVSIGKELGLDFPLEETVLPIVDFTPAPALSNLTFHNGLRFPLWQNDMLIGSLKGLSVYRLRIENDQLVEQETLVSDLGRIRDIEMGADGLVYIAIEHNDGGSIVRLVPEDS